MGEFAHVLIHSPYRNRSYAEPSAAPTPRPEKKPGPEPAEEA